MQGVGVRGGCRVFGVMRWCYSSLKIPAGSSEEGPGGLQRSTHVAADMQTHTEGGGTCDAAEVLSRLVMCVCVCAFGGGAVA